MTGRRWWIWVGPGKYAGPFTFEEMVAIRPAHRVQP